MRQQILASGFISFFVFTTTVFGFQDKSSALSTSFTVPFHQIAHLIMVEARAGDEQGLFILDTGAPELCLNTAHFICKRGSNSIRGVGGRDVEVKTGYYPFSLGKIEIRSKRAFLVDLSQIEAKRNIRILGLIGFSILKDYEILLDYGVREISFLELGKKNRGADPSLFYSQPSQVIPFRMKGHLPCLELSIGNTDLYVALDSGAGISVIDPGFQEALAIQSSDFRQARVSGYSQQQHMSHSVFLEGIQLSGLECASARAVFKPLTSLNKSMSGKDVVGLFGFELLRRYKWSINYHKQELAIWQGTADGQALVQKKE